ncbi:MAG TPA: tRNA (adenosine(37)-N6)-threonylcarbamoyltransferase complex transferase subunit TsaD [Patescibacteria group bacterium]|nr:tRNA (adenosine(37)-N6)-threonylcarbamoyltransferase complex transferase subunit TsaD [Patescibacteria group bacterium]
MTRSSAPLRVLGIETSCDETAVALVAFHDQQIEVIHHFVSSQIPIHQKYGGVVPEVAARSHVPETVSLITKALGETGMGAFDAIAVTSGPGLPTALRVGIEAARTIAYASKKSIIGINHLEGHIASAWLNEENRAHWKFPLLALIVSGGHTELVLMQNFGVYELIGQTRDDAAGEAFDKSAKLLGLPYPGGPEIAKRATKGNPNAFSLPRPMLDDPTFDFSFSGLKTAVRLAWQERQNPSETELNDFCASLEQAIVDILVQKTLRAAHAYHVHGILLVGGVSANEHLRRELGEQIRQELPETYFFPSDKAYITDNAAMIAAAGYWHLKKNEQTDWKTLDAKPDWNLV